MNVVVCVDESESSKLALKNAIEFANNTNSDITILNSLNKEVNHTDNSIIQESNKDAMDRVSNYLESLEEETRKLTDDNINVNSSIISDGNNNTVQSIINYVQDKNIYQIFIGHRAMDTKHEKLYGSFAKDMISKSPVPVVVTTTNCK